MFGQPPHGAAYLRNDAVEPRRRRQRVFDDREIDPERKQTLREEGEILLIVHLPIAAMDKPKRGRLRIGGEKQIEPLARSIAVGKVEKAGVFAPHPGTACRPIGESRHARGQPGSCCRRRRAGQGPFHDKAWCRLRSLFGGAVRAVCHAFGGSR